MRRSDFLGLGISLVLLAGTTVQARVSHGYSAVFAVDTVTAVGEQPGCQPQAAILGAICPNPFNPRTTIVFELAEAGPVELTIFDLRGRLVAVIEAGPRPSGHHQATWDGNGDDGRAAPAGTYFCRLCTPQGSHTRKLALVR